MNVRHQQARGDQRGIAMLDTVIGLLVGAMVVTPVLMWAYTAIGSSVSAEQASERAAAHALLRRYLTVDVATSTLAQIAGTDCAGGASGGTVLATFALPGDDDRRAVYSVVVDAAGRGTLWRRLCPPVGSVVDQTAIGANLLRPTGGWMTSVACSGRPGYVNDTCGNVSMTIRVRTAKAATVTATRRVGPPR